MRKAIPLITAFVCGFIIALPFYFLPQGGLSSLNRSIRENNNPYAFINPLLACNQAEYKEQKYEAIRESVDRYIINAVKNKVITDAGFYMKSPGGGWTGVNENKQFVPASLYKVPILITYFKFAEKSPELLNEKIDFILPVKANQQDIPPAKTLVSGEAYTIMQLLERMIIYSDNDAETLLFYHISQKYFEDVFSDLGLPPPSTVYESKITPKQFAFFLRVLYNASYLSRDYSEQALKLLSKADFDDGMRASIPEKITIAHKFGEFISLSGGIKSIELHECGIFYAKNPYIVCIMTRGMTLENNKKVLRDITKIFYEGQKGL